MKITDCPCRGCSKRAADCRLSCGRYKVYHTAKTKEYAEKLKEKAANCAIADHRIAVLEKRRKRSIKYTPKKNGAVKK